MKSVYIIRAGASCYKVGVAANVKSRVRELQTSNANRIEIVTIKLAENALEIERQLHGTLYEWKADGGSEWFILNDEQALDLCVALHKYPEVDVTDRAVIRTLLAEQKVLHNQLTRQLMRVEDAVRNQKNLKPSAGRVKPARSTSERFMQTDEELIDRAMEVFKSEGKASTSLLQRRLAVGYGRAARVMDKLEETGAVNKLEGNLARSLVG